MSQKTAKSVFVVRIQYKKVSVIILWLKHLNQIVVLNLLMVVILVGWIEWLD